MKRKRRRRRRRRRRRWRKEKKEEKVEEGPLGAPVMNPFYLQASSGLFSAD